MSRHNIMNLDVVKVIKNPSAFLVRSTENDNNQIYFLKLHVPNLEVELFTNFFPNINSSQFSRLVLPNAVEIGSLFSNHSNWVLMNYLGDSVIPWDEHSPASAGGSSVPVSFVTSFVEMLADLLTIDLSLIPSSFGAYDRQVVITACIGKANELKEQSLLSRRDRDKITKYFASIKDDEVGGNLIITNGDFQMRNFLVQPDGKVAVIDWSSIIGLEPISFPIMYQWTLMWNNPAWQLELVNSVMPKFNLDMSDLKYGLVVKSLTQAYFWRNNRVLYDRQIANCLTGISKSLT